MSHLVYSLTQQNSLVSCVAEPGWIPHNAALGPKQDEHNLFPIFLIKETKSFFICFFISLCLHFMPSFLRIADFLLFSILFFPIQVKQKCITALQKYRALLWDNIKTPYFKAQHGDLATSVLLNIWNLVEALQEPFPVPYLFCEQIQDYELPVLKSTGVVQLIPEVLWKFTCVVWIQLADASIYNFPFSFVLENYWIIGT